MQGATSTYRKVEVIRVANLLFCS